MLSVRRIFLIAQVWLTAFLTLFAGAPQWTCVCPDGHAKPFCLSVLPGLAGCCCADGPARAGCCEKPAGVKPCCRASHGIAAGKSSHSQAQCPGCRKTMTPSGVAAVPPTSDDGRLAVDLPACVGDFTALSRVNRASRTSDALTNQRHPPDDLILTLQRLVI